LPEEEKLVPHRLYGVRPAAEAGNLAWWRAAALAEMEAAHAQGRTPILCGGTGLYLASLSQGPADLPDPGPQARLEARTLLADEGPAALHARLSAADPQTAATLRPTDGQRLARAWEVWRGTGRGLAAWHEASAAQPSDWDLRAILLDPPRAELRAAIAARFAAMLASGALEEVKALQAAGLDPALPAMRAHGVPELSAYLRGEITLEQAAHRAVLATGQYTKRQATWFRHRPIAASTSTHSFLARSACFETFMESFCGLNILNVFRPP
jgi:tRNA dimethylallyltransferase